MLDGDSPVYTDVAGDGCLARYSSLTVFCHSFSKCLSERCALEADGCVCPENSLSGLYSGEDSVFRGVLFDFEGDCYVDTEWFAQSPPSLAL
ncbi:hypothetical protein CDL15_Pgr023797 [Punica granatum]|uniref:Uncharacterized protein n=1 Tax=Punica granatum TaxID=22663 RepID=A0A218VY66_PUNGR|nr:hypothetical protein CDL15_Pgr023797 [Punica granatum]